jgi:hypothetical protein
MEEKNQVFKIVMMKRKAVLYVLGAAVVIFLMILLLRDRKPFGGSNTSFAASPADRITRIEFTTGNSSLTLSEEGEEWLVNGKQPARRSSILFITRILTEMQIKSPVSDELFNSGITAMGIEPVAVKVYERYKLLSSFLVYKTASNQYGNIMKLKPGSKPYIVSVPGSEAEIGSAFTVNELFWQPYTVFSLQPSEIHSVTFENLSDTSSSFMIKHAGGIPSLFGNDRELTGWDTSRVMRYISYFAQVPFESWATELTEAEKAEISGEPPLYRVTVLSSEGEIALINLWKRTITEQDSVRDDTDRMWARKQGETEFFITKYADIDPIIKKRSYFLPGQ